MNHSQPSSTNKALAPKILGFLSFGSGLTVSVLPFVNELLDFALGRYPFLPLTLVFAALGSGIVAIAHSGSSLSAKILAIIGMCFSVSTLAAQFLVLSIH